jgi:hypothetical protein
MYLILVCQLCDPEGEVHVSTESLSKLEGTSIADLAAMSDSMQSYIRSSTVEARKAAVENMGAQGPLMRRLFPNQLQRENNRIAIEGVRQVAQAKAELLGLYMTTQIEIAKKKADALVAAQGMQIQTTLVSFADEQMRLLSKTLNSSRSEFLAQIAPKLDEVENYKKYPVLYDRAAAAVEHHIESYFENCRILLDGFTASLSNKVSQITK